jgi:hypothetical protein
MTNQQMNWAASHDWFVRDAGNGFAVVRDQDTDEGYRVFGTFAAMRRWAGY